MELESSRGTELQKAARLCSDPFLSRIPFLLLTHLNFTSGVFNPRILPLTLPAPTKLCLGDALFREEF